MGLGEDLVRKGVGLFRPGSDAAEAAAANAAAVEALDGWKPTTASSRSVNDISNGIWPDSGALHATLAYRLARSGRSR